MKQPRWLFPRDPVLLYTSPLKVSKVPGTVMSSALDAEVSNTFEEES